MEHGLEIRFDGISEDEFYDRSDSQVSNEFRVIVKSGVCPFESSGDLIEFCHLDSVFEFDSGDHLRQVIESA